MHIGLSGRCHSVLVGFGACLEGNGAIIGANANIVIVDLVRKAD